MEESSILSAKFDCPMTRQNFQYLLTTAHDCEIGLFLISKEAQEPQSQVWCWENRFSIIKIDRDASTDASLQSLTRRQMVVASFCCTYLLIFKFFINLNKYMLTMETSLLTFL